MSRTRWVCSFSRGGALAGLAVLHLGFTPFTTVKNVCPACPRAAHGAATDTAVLKSGQRVECAVAAQNSEFYVLERHGEYRALPRAELAKIERRAGAAKEPVAKGDQLLLKNGVVLHGAITEEKPGLYFVMQVADMKHIVWHSQVKSAFRQGNPLPLTKE